jgi:hypothetical protein
MTGDTLIKSYKRIDTTTTMEQDAKEAFSQIVPFIQAKYPFIHFDPIDGPQLSKDSDGGYHVYGSYESKLLGFIPEDKFVVIGWGKTDWPSDNVYENYVPSIKFEFGYEFGNLGELEDILAKNIKVPKNEK